MVPRFHAHLLQLYQLTCFFIIAGGLRAILIPQTLSKFRPFLI